MANKNGLGLYIHIPFCIKKCNYCDFLSFDNKQHLSEEYVECLKHEIRILSSQCKGYKFNTIFIGGGTPSSINEKYIEDILEESRKHLQLDNMIEISIESNPGTLSKDKLKTFAEVGVNRLSIGLQTSQDILLKKLGRIHNYEQFEKGYLLARDIGIKNINVDLIFGLPDQTLKNWEETLNKVVGLKPEHISCYSLKIEENTPFFRVYCSEVGSQRLETRNRLPSEDEERKMYHYAIKFLGSKGYKHYEISNFCLPGFECRHNLIYWKCGSYIGVGAGAHSYFIGNRFHNETSLERYISIVRNGNLPKVDIETIAYKESISEYLILGLRLISGIDKEEFRKKFEIPVEDIYPQQIERFVNLGLLHNDKVMIRLTSKGLDLANLVMAEFIQ